MAWAGRYRRGFTNGYQVIGGKPLLGLLMGFGGMLIVRSLIAI
jgi:hypothetical protein